MKKQTGFTLIEVLLMILVLAVIGFGGYYVWNNQQKNESTQTTKTTNPTPQSKKSDQYTGWKTYTLKNEKLTFRYPATWKLEDSSQETADSVTLTTSDGFSMSINDGVSAGGDPLTLAEDSPMAVSYLGDQIYLVFVHPRQGFGNTTDPSLVVNALLLKNPKDQLSWPLGKTAVGPNNTDGQINGRNIAILAGYGNKNPLTLEAATNDPEYKNAKLVIGSMHY